MFLRSVIRATVNAPKVNFLRYSSTEAGSAAQNDEPIEMPNPFEREKVKCILCKHGLEVDYKNVRMLSQFQSPHTGRIYGRHITGLCKNQQKKVEAEITKSQALGLMGYYHKDVRFIKDPKLFDPERPIRPHKY